MTGSLVRTTGERADGTRYPDIRREWVRRPRETPAEGVIVGVRHLQNGRIVVETESDGYFSVATHTSWRCDEIVPAFLVATDLYVVPVLVSIEDVEAIA